MVRTADYAEYQKLLKKDSILRSFRRGGGGAGLFAAGIMLVVFAIPIAMIWFVDYMIGWLLLAAIVGIPGLILLVVGALLMKKRRSSWMSYYMKSTGYTESELQQVDRELASSNVRIISSKVSGGVKDGITCIITEHYFVMRGMDPYVRRLEDMIAVAFSDSNAIWFMVSLSKQDKEALALPLVTDSDKKPALCREIIEELHKQNPAILRGQEIICEGQSYILERDSAEILRLYREGHQLEERA